MTPSERMSKVTQMQQDELISAVTHELRTPLTSIRALSDILHNNPDLDIQQRQQFLKIIMQESERLTEVVDEVIDLTELELGSNKEYFIEVDLRDVVQETVQAVSNLLQEKHIIFQLRCPDEDFRIIIDQRRVMQVIITLLTNAINFCQPDQGWIGVRLLRRDDVLQVTISDNGPPIGQNNRPCLAGESEQSVDATDSALSTTLDLLISQEVITCLGGRLWAEPNLQYGAKFSFCLPLKPTYQNC